MLILMAMGKELTNPDLKKIGISIDKKSRLKLNDLDLLFSYKQNNRAFAHRLTEKGWVWCAKELLNSCPPRSGSAGPALYAILAGLSRYFDRTNLELSDVFGSSATPRAGMIPSTPDVETRIRNAYNSLAKEPRDWVRLAHLRQRLSDVAKGEVDAVLLRMSEAKSIRLTLEENQKTLTKEDREASIRLGPNEMHLMAIEE